MNVIILKLNYSLSFLKFSQYDGAYQSLTENTRFEGATSPQAEITAHQNCKADFRSDVAYNVGVWLSAFFADLDCELFHNARCRWPCTAQAGKNQCVEAAVFALCSFIQPVVNDENFVKCF